MSEEKRVEETVVEALPEKTAEKLNDTKRQIIEINSQFFGLSNELVGIQEELSRLYNERKAKANIVQQTLNYAAEKLKLAKRTGYNWKFDGVSNFVGTPVKENPTEK